MREDARCALADAQLDELDWMEVYTELIKPGYVDPMNEDVRYLQVARIGNRVENAIEAEHNRRLRKRLEKHGR